MNSHEWNASWRRLISIDWRNETKLIPKMGWCKTKWAICNFCRAMRCLCRHAVSVCLSVRLFVCHVRELCQNELRYLLNFFTVGQPRFSTPNGIAIFRREPPPPNGGVECRWDSALSQILKLSSIALFDANDDFYRYLLRLTRKFYGFITTENHHFGRESKNEWMTICRQIAFQESWLADNDRQKNLTHFRYIRSKFWQKIKWN